MLQKNAKSLTKKLDLIVNDCLNEMRSFEFLPCGVFLEKGYSLYIEKLNKNEAGHVVNSLVDFRKTWRTRLNYFLICNILYFVPILGAYAIDLYRDYEIDRMGVYIFSFQFIIFLLAIWILFFANKLKKLEKYLRKTNREILKSNQLKNE